jgi:hypothetical protein
VLAPWSSAHTAHLVKSEICDHEAGTAATKVVAPSRTPRRRALVGTARTFFCWIKGDSSAPAYVDQLSFSISGVQTSGGYELQPTLLDAPGGGQPWVMFWDNVSASAKSCTKDTTHSQEVCTQSGPNNQSNFGAPLPGEELHWLYLVDFTGSVQLSTDTIVNLRAQFLDSAGKNAGILSPDGGQLTRVPEPSSLLLCAAGFIATVGRLRRRTAIHKS